MERDKTTHNRDKREGNQQITDRLVGQKLRQKRTLLGLSQAEVAAKVGITFQQLQKYEQGINRIGASRLYSLAKALETDISYFFKTEQSVDDNSTSEDQEKHDPANTRETLELVRAYSRITDDKLRKEVRDLIDTILDSQP
ncbi:helix-turn-helix domain-containing protein [Sneathiella sp. P13V-1]|uniref:helix-turn-helix domain-containing protein n=1 Tax=Sneathiella sp. P13V-1 TaxID=2697366 RepID=UPI00187B899B|nr:helix-turn-helix transcriptional regulator [Sneathiella sp. P13V-1]MBE7637193.1 helix-turn-helix domain-containing protein [Sneathiella sp. P13V-1]